MPRKGGYTNDDFYRVLGDLARHYEFCEYLSPGCAWRMYANYLRNDQNPGPSLVYLGWFGHGWMAAPS